MAIRIESHGGDATECYRSTQNLLPSCTEQGRLSHAVVVLDPRSTYVED